MIEREARIQGRAEKSRGKWTSMGFYQELQGFNIQIEGHILHQIYHHYHHQEEHCNEHRVLITYLLNSINRIASDASDTRKEPVKPDIKKLITREKKLKDSIFLDQTRK